MMWVTWHSQLITEGFCWCKVLLAAFTCWQQLARSDWTEDTRGQLWWTQEMLSHNLCRAEKCTQLKGSVFACCCRLHDWRDSPPARPCAVPGDVSVGQEGSSSLHYLLDIESLCSLGCRPASCCLPKASYDWGIYRSCTEYFFVVASAPKSWLNCLFVFVQVMWPDWIRLVVSNTSSILLHSKH